MLPLSQALRSVARISQLLLALLLAATYEFIRAFLALLRRGSLVEFRALFASLPHLFAALLAKQELPDEIVADRLAVCRNCPIYFAPLRTCGSPLRDLSRRLRRLQKLPSGCYCHLPTKARLHENCWAYDERLPDLGWPAALNSFPRTEDFPKSTTWAGYRAALLQKGCVNPGSL